MGKLFFLCADHIYLTIFFVLAFVFLCWVMYKLFQLDVVKAIITWCKNHVNLIIVILLIPFTLFLCWIAYISLGLEIIKAFGPAFVSCFLTYIAYGQLQVSTSQKEISKQQLVSQTEIAKQQADTAQKKVELDIRDKRYDIYRLWNKEYSNFISFINTSKPTYLFDRSYENLLLISDELFYVFSEESRMSDLFKQLKLHYDKIEKIKNDWNDFEYKNVSDPALCGEALLHPQDIERQQDYEDQKIYEICREMNKVRKELLKLAIQEMKIS